MIGRVRGRRRWAPAVVAAAALVAAACGAEDAAPPASGSAARRVVTLAPSITEIVYALGAGERVVGACAQCDWPEEAARLPRVGSYLVPSVEAVLALRPDVAFAVPSPGNREAVRAIERAGVRVAVVQDRTLADLWAGIRTAADVLGMPDRGEALVARLRAELAAVGERVAGRPAPRALLVVGHRPLIVAGRGTLQSDLLAAAGARNAASDLDEGFPQIGLEAVVALAPEVIVDAAMGSEAGGRALFAGLAPVPAVAAGRIVSVDADGLFRAGPRVGAAAEALARAIHPEAFEPGGR